MTAESGESLSVMLKTLKLPTFAACCEEFGEKAAKQGWSYTDFLHQLAETELAERRRRKIGRLRKSSGLSHDKTLATVELERLPTKVRRQVPLLCEGGFVDKTENVLAFGNPGTGKTLLFTAIGHELVSRGYKVLFTPAFRLVQRLLVARRDLTLEKELKRLDRFNVVILDDIGYIQQDAAEMEVLFTFLGERYERRSVMITSNLVFSQWDRIFKDPMTTAAAIDRVVHHSIIFELTGSSYRTEAAKKRNRNTGREKDREKK
ncbi:MAG: ATP-binding protein [bacterium]|nr:ATP-binding protein [bacterium]